MTYDFDSITPRRATGCVKWDSTEADDVLPLWVADMDFQAAPCIREALQRRLDHGVFGYTRVTEQYYDSIIRWFGQRHGWTLQRPWIQYTTGVVPAISCIVKALTMPGDRVIVATPVYNCFFTCIRNNGCEVAEVPLLISQDGTYRMDWEGFEQACADEKAVAFILCNPHNPGGRTWTPDELARIGNLCRQHGVTVISDEIHNEIVMPGNHYTPFASLSDDNQQCSVTCISPSKSFNIAGLQMACIVCSDPTLSRRIDRAININEVCDVNPFAPVATIAAYTPEGAEWLEQMNAYVYENYRYLQTFLQQQPLPFTLMPLQATYLAWVDMSQLCQRLSCNSEELEQRLINEAHIYFNAGSHYGTAGEHFMRINLACPRAILVEACQRFAQFIAATYA